MVGTLVDCCARAASGHAAIVPPIELAPPQLIGLQGSLPDSVDL
jgi:hypothetical protein